MNQNPTEPSSTNAPLRVLIAEDYEIIRQALAAFLLSQGLEVVGQAGDGSSAVRLAKALRPDVVVMDMRMPDLAGADATRLVRRDCPSIAVVALSAHSELEWVEAAFNAGAAGYVLKDAAYDDLPNAIDTVIGGGIYVSSRIPGGAAFMKDRAPS